MPSSRTVCPLSSFHPWGQFWAGAVSEPLLAVEPSGCKMACWEPLTARCRVCGVRCVKQWADLGSGMQVALCWLATFPLLPSSACFPHIGDHNVGLQVRSHTKPRSVPFLAQLALSSARVLPWSYKAHCELPPTGSLSACPSSLLPSPLSSTQLADMGNPLPLPEVLTCYLPLGLGT